MTAPTGEERILAVFGLKPTDLAAMRAAKLGGNVSVEERRRRRARARRQRLARRRQRRG